MTKTNAKATTYLIFTASGRSEYFLIVCELRICYGTISDCLNWIILFAGHSNSNHLAARGLQRTGVIQKQNQLVGRLAEYGHTTNTSKDVLPSSTCSMAAAIHAKFHRFAAIHLSMGEGNNLRSSEVAVSDYLFTDSCCSISECACWQIDLRHRYGHNLHIYYDGWSKSQSTEPSIGK